MENPVYISVITPCYNSAAFIESAILSVISQPVSGIEMIIVDDGSTDDTEKICVRYHGRIRYYKTENMGAGHARNFALTKARGTWIAYLDADDLFLHNSISTEMICKLQTFESKDVDVVYTPWITIDMNMEKSLCIHQSEAEGTIQHIPKHEFWTCLYRRTFLTGNGIRFYEYREQDIATAFRYLVFSKSPKVQTHNDIRFHLQRVNPNSNVHTWKRQVMHGVKAQVYFDLLENHAVAESRGWLFGIVVEQIHEYYKEVIKEGYISEVTLKRVNYIYKKSVTLAPELLKATRSRRRFMSNALLWMLSNTVCKRAKSDEIEVGKYQENRREDSSDIMKKLRPLSEFLLMY